AVLGGALQSGTPVRPDNARNRQGNRHVPAHLLLSVVGLSVVEQALACPFRIQSRFMKSILTPLDFLARSAFVYRDRIAAVEGERKFTYAEFDQRIHRLASAL